MEKVRGIEKLYGTVFRPSVWREITVDTLTLEVSPARYRVTVWRRDASSSRLRPAYYLNYTTSRAAWRAARDCYYGNIPSLFMRLDQDAAERVERRDGVARRRYYGGVHAKARRDELSAARVRQQGALTTLTSQEKRLIAAALLDPREADLV